MRFLILFVATAFCFAQTRGIAVISHRGEHLSHPENTMAAYKAAIDLGVDYIEVDVQATSDGKLVLMHDSEVRRTTNGSGKIAQMTFAEVSSTSNFPSGWRKSSGHASGRTRASCRQ